jgi:UDP-2,3-diacylglucosamine hydrolase
MQEPMKRVLFLSDVHLEPRDPKKTVRFERFLDDCSRKGAEEVYILGDLFHFWIGPEHSDLPDYRSTLRRLQEMVRGGVRITFLHGNRDFYVGRRFQSLTGVKVVPGDLEIRLGPKRVYLAHGDMFCSRDKLYRYARYVLRSKPWKHLYHRFPVKVKYSLARGYRGFSKWHVSKKSERTKELVPQTLRRIFGRGADVIVCGHVHACQKRVFIVGSEEKIAFVLGSWEEGNSYLEFDGKDFVLYNGKRRE